MPILPDVLEPGLRVVFCGTRAGNKSADIGAYYAGPTNKFWAILSATGLTPRRLQPHEFRDVTRFGIGLTDLDKDSSGPDASLVPNAHDPVGLRQRIMGCQPKTLAFNGKKAAAIFYGKPTTRQVEYGRQPEPVGCTAVFVLPSTSGASRHWDAQHWRDLAEFLRDG